MLEPAATVAAPKLSPGRRIARNAASILLGDAAANVIIAMAIALAAVKLGPAGFGQLTEAQAFMEPFDALAGLGLGSVAITIAAKRGSVDGSLRGSILGIRMVSSLIAALVGIAAAIATGRTALLPVIAVIAIGFLLTPIIVVTILPYQFDQAIHRRIAVPSLVAFVRLGTAYLAFWMYNKPIAYQLSGLSSAIASALLGYLFARKHYPAKLVFDRELVAQLLKLGWPAAVLEFVVMAYSRFSYFLLHGAGPAVQGEYAAADRLIAPVLGLAGAVVVSSLPTLATLAAQHEYEQLMVAYKRAIVRIVALIIPIAAAAWVLTTVILRKLVPAYSGAVWPFRVLSIGALFMFLNQMSSSFIIALGRFRLIMTVAIVNLFVYLALSTYLIPRYRALGAAISTATMEGVNTLMQIVIVFWLLKVSRKPVDA